MENQKRNPPKLNDNRIQPVWTADGLPICHGLCAVKDGKLGCLLRPDDDRASIDGVTLCRPAVIDMVEELAARQG